MLRMCEITGLVWIIDKLSVWQFLAFWDENIDVGAMYDSGTSLSSRVLSVPRESKRNIGFVFVVVGPPEDFKCC